MTDAEPTQSFLQLWAVSLTQVLSQIAGAAVPVTLLESVAEAPAPDAGDLHATITAGGTVRGEMALRIPKPSAMALARIFLGGPDEATADLSEDDRGAVEELIRQVAGYISTAAKAKWKDVPLTVAMGEAHTWPPAASGWLQSEGSAPRRFALEWKTSAALNTSLSAAEQAQTSPAKEKQLEPDSSPALGLFMGLELDVSLRFGGRDVLLKDLIDLGPGSVLELDRGVDDPADLLLDGRLIARGQVVMVNGNYGLKVTEVVAGIQA